ncbi:MAG: hypothetical protein R6V06_05090 [Kiritimatiellia bacterium]
MNTLIKTVTLCLFFISMKAIVQAQSINIQPKSKVSEYSDAPELLRQKPKAITAERELRMYELVSSIYTNKSKYKSSIRITVTHRNRIAQRPDVCVAKWTPQLVQELYKLRSSYLELMQRVANENADMRMRGMPNVTTRYGHRQTNIFKRSDRDKERNERRAEQSAILQLKRLIRSHFKERSFGITDHITHHYRLPEGKYLLCIIQRVKDTESKTALGSKTALWWTTFTVEKNITKALYLDESNAISWREIFETERS